MRLAKAGWFGGDPNQVMKAPADMVLNAINYEIFEKEVNQAYHQINKEP